MDFKVDTRKRFRIHETKLWEIKSADNHSDENEWFSLFVKRFGEECGLLKTSVKGTRFFSLYKRTYFFKIIDKHKFFLAKIKYGF